MVNFPNSLDDDITLFVAVNNTRTTLTSAIDDLVTTIPVDSTTGFPSTGFISILTGADITDTEAISYTGTTATQFTGATRGAGSTTAVSHNSGNNVDLTVVADHHNSLKDAVIELEIFVGVSGSENFLPKDEFGNVVVTGTLEVFGASSFNDVTITGSVAFTSVDLVDLNVTNSGIFNDVCVTGTLELVEMESKAAGSAICINSDFDIKQDLTVSGTIKLGDPPAATVGPLFASQDTEQTISENTTFTDANCETTALQSGVEYLIIYSSNFGSNDRIVGTEVQILHGATVIGFVGSGPSELSGNPTPDTHYSGGQCNGIFKVTGDGSNTVKFQFRSATFGGSSNQHIGAMSIIAIPLDDFTENTDYFFDGLNSNSQTLSNASTLPTFDTIRSSDFTMDAGEYLVFFSVEPNPDAGTPFHAVLRNSIAGAQVGPDWQTSGRSFGGNSRQGFCFGHVVNIAGGSTTFLLEGSTGGGVAFADFRRPRVFAIKTSLFDQVISTKNTSGQTTNSSTYIDFSGLTTAVVPTIVNNPMVIIGTTNSYTTVANSRPLHQIRNESSGSDFRLDGGAMDGETGGSGSDEDLLPIFLSHFEKISVSSTYKWQFKSDGAGGTVAVGRNNLDTAGELSEFVVWSLNAAGDAGAAISRTCIEGNQIIVGTVVTDNLGVGTITAGNLIVTGSGGFEELSVTATGIFNDVCVTGTLEVDTIDSKAPGGAILLDADMNVQGDLTVFGNPVSTGVEGGGGSSTLQEAYDTGNGVIFLDVAKPVIISGTEYNQDVDFKVIGSGIFTEALQVGSGTSYIDSDRITAPTVETDILLVNTSASFDGSVTISGNPVSTGTNGGGGGSTTLQQAYDAGSAIILTDVGKPFVIQGEEYNQDVDFKVIGSGIFTEALQVGSGTSYIDSNSVTSPSANFDTLFVAGEAVTAGSGATISGVISNKLDTTHSPVALYQFDGSSADTSGNAFDLGSFLGKTHLNNGLAGVVCTEIGIMTGPADATLQILGNLTLQALVCVDELVTVSSSNFRIIRNNESGETEAANNVYTLLVLENGQLGYRAEEGGGISISFDSGGIDRLMAGVTYHIALIRENNDVTFYVNGEIFGDVSSGLNAPTGGTSSTINVSGGNGVGQRVAIASVKVIDSALTAAQIYAEYQKTWAS